jgi:hypothetical protein
MFDDVPLIGVECDVAASDQDGFALAFFTLLAQCEQSAEFRSTAA